MTEEDTVQRSMGPGEREAHVADHMVDDSNAYPFHDFSDLFHKSIMKRAHMYYDNGYVLSATQTESGFWHAFVQGETVYQVDIRIRHGKVISAACTCPFAQHVTYCKHAGAVLLSLQHEWAHNHNAADKEHSTDGFPHRASFEVDTSGPRLFPNVGNYDNEEWKMVRHLLEKASKITQLDNAMRLYSLSALTDEPDEPSCASSLSHGWYTMLESAYEHLHDRQGLCNLYMYYILTTHDERDCIYVRQLRDMAQDQWSTYCATMVKLMQKRRPIGSRALLPYPAYERLLREEHLSDAAMQFWWAVGVLWPFDEHRDRQAEYRRRDTLLRLLDTIALEHADAAKNYTLNELLSPESGLYYDQSSRTLDRVEHWVRRFENTFGTSETREAVQHIVEMYPHRDSLKDRLSAWLTDYGEEDR